MNAADDERILVLAPLGRDAELAVDVLTKAGLHAVSCRDVADLQRRIADGAGCALVTEETLTVATVTALSEQLAEQPPWSDFPLIAFSAARARANGSQAVRSLGNVTILERPVRLRGLIAAVHAALRARRRQYEAKRAIEQRDQFLAMLGHELRNPLGPILFAAELLKREHDPAAIAKQRAIIERQGRHMARLVDDLLDVSRVTSGKVILQRESVDLRALVERCVQAMEPTFAAREQSLTASYGRAPIFVDGDVVRLEQIVSNLLTNASKYTPRRGRASVELELVAGEALLRVRDSGIGIDPSMLEPIFDLFTQAPSGLDRSQGGLGLGLTLVRSLVTLHGGTVTAESEGSGHGSSFIVRLPSRVQLVSLPATAVRDDVCGAGPGLRIVIVDDNADLRETLQSLLESCGHDVTTAEDGRSGLRRILAEKPEAAIVDIGLPSMNGYEVATQVRAALGDSIVLVAMTGYGQPEDRASALAAGFDVHLTKPVAADALFGALTRAAADDGKQHRGA
ncbi:MAG: histidine kinase [bacterium]|nr:histidine kinase [bacterium]